MWVYIKTDRGQLYTVGFFRPADDRSSFGIAEFISDSDHSDREEAARRVNYLNGGRGEPYDFTPA